MSKNKKWIKRTSIILILLNLLIAYFPLSSAIYAYVTSADYMQVGRNTTGYSFIGVNSTSVRYIGHLINAPPPLTDSDNTMLGYLNTFNGTVMTGSIMNYVNITQPSNFYTENTSISTFGASFINTMLDAGNWPRTLFWFPFVFFLAIALGFVIFKFTKSLLLQCTVSEIVLGMFVAAGLIPAWVLVIFPIEALAILIAQHQYGW